MESNKNKLKKKRESAAVAGSRESKQMSEQSKQMSGENSVGRHGPFS